MRRTRSLLSLLSFMIAFALAWRREDRSYAVSMARLKPHGDAANGAARSKNAGSSAARPRSPQKVGGQTAPGFDAGAPQDIPPLGWWMIAKRTAQKFGENELMSEAASVTFYALLSLFPAITAIVSIYGLFTDRATISGHLDGLSSLLPSGGMEIISDQVKRLTQSPASGLSLGAVIGVLTALWSANQGTKAMFSALNDVYGERERRSFIRLTTTSLTFTVGGILILLAGIGLIVLLPLAFSALGISAMVDDVAQIARWPLILAVIVGALAVLYRYGPSRSPAQWQWVTWGGFFAALMWVSLSVGFSWYVTNFGNYNKTYGSLGAIIGFMTWIWLSSTVLLLGAQVNAEMEVQTVRDSTAGHAKPIGQRGAAAADAPAPRD